MILNKPVVDFGKLDKFTEEIELLRANGCWEKSDILKLFYDFTKFRRQRNRKIPGSKNVAALSWLALKFERHH